MQAGQYVRERAVVGMTGLSISKIRKLRVYGGGPRYVKLGRAVAYDPADVTRWLEARKVGSTSEAGVAA